jgi:hypothetical protein
MMTAQAQIDTLTKEAEVLRKQSRTNRIWRWTLIVVCVALIAVAVLQRQSDVNSCHNANAFKAGNVQIWQEFVRIALPPHAPAASVAKANALLHGVETVDAARACPGFFG